MAVLKMIDWARLSFKKETLHELDCFSKQEVNQELAGCISLKILKVLSRNN